MADKYQDEKRAKGLSGAIRRNFGPDQDGNGYIPNMLGEAFISGLTFRTELGRKTPLPLLLVLIPSIGATVLMSPQSEDILRDNAKAAPVDAAITQDRVIAATTSDDRSFFYVAIRHGDEYRMYRGRERYSGNGYELEYIDNPGVAMGTAAMLAERFANFSSQAERSPAALANSMIGVPKALVLEGLTILHKDDDGEIQRRASDVQVAPLSGAVAQEAAGMAQQWLAVTNAISDGGYPYANGQVLVTVADMSTAQAESASKTGIISNIGFLLAGWAGLSLAAGATVASRRSRAGFKSRSQKP